MSRISVSARRSICLLTTIAGVLFPLTLSVAAQVRARITSPVDQASMITLKGNTLPMANSWNDLGRVPDETSTGRLMMVLKHSPEQQATLDRLIAAQQNSGSPDYHQWLSTSAYASQFGVADADISTVTAYLSSQGFKVTRVFPNKMAVEFSGTAGQVRSAFKTEIHSFSFQGQKFMANARDPQIPSALAPVISGVPLTNFHGVSKSRTAVKMTGEIRNGRVHSLYTDNSAEEENLSPGDIAKIYDIPSTYTGAGVTVGVVNDSNVNLAYVTNYQTTFGLKVQYPTVIIDGDDPGETSNEIDGIEQLELLSAVAPNATLYYYASASSAAEDGLDDGYNFALIRAVDDDQVQVLLNDSENCEAGLGAAGAELVNSVAEEAAAQGITFIAAAGNGGSDSCQSFSGYGNTYVSAATEGLSVNGYASTPYVTAVGATDFFYDVYYPAQPFGTAGEYWNLNNGDTSYTSALGYIPEQPWNASDGTTNYYGSIGLVAATGGGISTLGAVGDTSTGPYPLPDWQSNAVRSSSDPAVAAATGRVVPDIAMFGGNGLNGSSYALCAQANECVGGGPGTLVYETAGGTDVSSATFAGIAALIVQAHGVQGNLNPELYTLAQTTPAAFHAMVVGTNAVACSSGPNCGSNAYLADSTGGLAYQATASGYNAAVGLGSVDVGKLIAAWSSPFSHATTTTFTLTSPGTSTPISSFVHGTEVQGNVAVSLTSGSGTVTGDVSIVSTTPLANNKGVTWYTLAGGKVTDTTFLDGLPGGTYSLNAHYAGALATVAGAGGFAPSNSAPFQITVTPESSTIDIVNLVNLIQGGTTTVSYGTNVSAGLLIISATNPNSIGAPTGVVKVYDNNSLLTTVAIDSTALATFTAQLPVGSHSLTFSYPGDASYESSTATAAFAVNVSAQGTTTTIASTGVDDPTGSYVRFIATVSSNGTAATGMPPTGTVTFKTTGGTTLGTAPLAPGTNSSGILAGIADYQLPGSHLGGVGESVVAVYVPATTSNYAASTSTSIPISAAKSASVGKTLSKTTIVTGDGAASYFDYDGSITFNLTVARRTGTQTTTPTGTVSVYANGVLLGTPSALSNGAGSVVVQQNAQQLLTPPLTLGANLIVAQYSGDKTYGQSTAETTITLLDEGSLPDFSVQSMSTYGTISSTVSSAAFTLQLTSINNFAALGRAISFTATAPAGISCTFGAKTVAFSTTSNYATNTVSCGAAAGYSIARLSPSEKPLDRFWFASGGAVLAGVFLLGIPARRRQWKKMLGMVFLLFLSLGLIGGAVACSSSGGAVSSGFEQAAAGGQAKATPAAGKTLAAGSYQVLLRASAAFDANGQADTSADQEHTLPLQIVVQ